VSPEKIFDQFEALLEQERLAIRSLDAQRVASLADQKEALLGALRACSLPTQPQFAERMTKLVKELRRNGVLLANARDCLRDVLSACQGGSQLPSHARGAHAAALPPTMVSYRG